MRTLSFIIFLFLSIKLSAQPKSHIEHYSLQEGLPQRTVMDIIQDRKGFIWIATWDGLCKFDGYNFTTYKTFPEDSILMSNNRIDKIVEDIYGYIWVCSYNQETFKFDPKTEKYLMSFNVDGMLFKANDIQVKPSGKVWLISDKMGTICTSDSLGTIKTFSLKQKNLPSNKVNSVFEDDNNITWILTDNGLVKVAENLSDKQITYYSVETSSSVRKAFYSAIENDNEIWFGASNGQILIYDKDIKRFVYFDTGIDSDIISIKKVYENLYIILSSQDGFIICDKNKANIKRVNKSTFNELPTNQILSCYVDNNHNIWLEMNSKGVAKYNLLENRLKFYLPNDYDNNKNFLPSYFIFEDKMGHVWVHPHGGFSFYDKERDKLLPFFNNPLSNDWKFSDILHNVYLDKQGNIWLSTRSGGLEKIVFDNTFFKLNDFYSNKISITGPEVRSILEDRDNNIWLGNMNGIISIYDSKRNFLGILNRNGTITKDGIPLKSASYSLHQDKKGNIWIGTKGDGLYLLKPKEGYIRSFTIEQFKNDSSNKYSLSNNNIYSIHEDNYGNIWIGTYGGGINLFDPKEEIFLNHNNVFNNYPIDMGLQIRTVKSHEDNIYLGTTLGLIVLSIDEKELKIKQHKIYSKRFKEKDGLRANDIHNIVVTKDHDVYIATFGGGMSKVISYDNEGFPLRFKTYDSHNGLSSDIVLSITEDNNKHLWINSEGSLSKFNPEDESFEQYNDVSRAISNQHFMETQPLLTSDGELIYGCALGTLSFFPDKISKNNYVPYLALTKFKVSNNDYTLKTHIDDANGIILGHKENIFSIEYAALDFNNPQGISYAYKLDGFNDEWINNQNQRVANYTNIPPGEYVFRVKSTNSNGTWIENERSLIITITPSFWQTKWAFVIYVISFILILYIILRSIFIFYRMRDKVLLEREQTEMKTRFFTDISHEIRTPLTMIVSPIENIIHNAKANSETITELRLVLKNANRMLRMVNQILDFRKIQKQRLQIKEIAIGNYIEELSNTTFKIIGNQGSDIVVHNQINSDKIWVDPDAIEKLAYNLISNSIKYSPKGKNIEINIFRKDKSVALQVKDQGEGMTKEVLNKLFTRFASYSKDKSKPSTGIGLSIVKEIVDKHHAKILVESDIQKGTTFTILFQSGLDHFSKDENVDVLIAENNNGETEEFLNDLHEKDILIEESTNQRLSILIVEDDPDLRSFIKSVLVDLYNVFEAKNGIEGYEKATRLLPDFILSDIMMPEMDGIEFLQRIRENQNTSHIPFILLTAKTGEDSELEGTVSGADDYITKPFNVKLLIAKIKNILRQRKNFTNHITTTSANLSNDNHIEKKNITEQDEIFLNNLREDIYNNMDNSDFTIEDLVNSTNLSRRVFFNKVKSLTGLAPVEFVREIRIKYAAELIKTQQYRIKEVIYMVGFSDVRYFTQCFKEIYGLTPGQYKDQFKHTDQI